MGKIAEFSKLGRYPRSYISRFIMSNNVTATLLDVSAGECRDSTDSLNIRLSNAITGGLIQTSGSWAAGSTQNKLDTGARANTTWYHVHAIRTATSEEGDWLFSLSATTPTLPTSYTAFRRIGSVKTDGSGNIVSFVQRGDYFEWATISQDISASNFATTAITRTLNTPLGSRVLARVYLGGTSTSDLVDRAVLLTDLAVTDEVVSFSNASWNGGMSATGTTWNTGENWVWTDTNSQIRTRSLNSASANFSMIISTRGWVDPRGKDA